MFSPRLQAFNDVKLIKSLNQNVLSKFTRYVKQNVNPLMTLTRYKVRDNHQTVRIIDARIL